MPPFISHIATQVVSTNTYSLDLELSSSQYASITDASQTGLDLSTDFSLEAWINLEQLPSTAGSNFTVLSKSNQNDNPTIAYHLFVSSGDNRLYVYFASGSNATYAYMNEAFDGDDVGTWIHVAVSMDISGPTPVFYKNGGSSANTMPSSAATAINNTAVAFRIGASETTGTVNKFFDGKIDEVRVWNDIRTSGEISGNYNTELVGDEAGLVSYWRLNNDYTDETSNGNDLTASGSPVFSTDTPF